MKRTTDPYEKGICNTSFHVSRILIDNIKSVGPSSKLVFGLLINLHTASQLPCKNMRVINKKTFYIHNDM